jgi:hypothetical protein
MKESELRTPLKLNNYLNKVCEDAIVDGAKKAGLIEQNPLEQWENVFIMSVAKTPTFENDLQRYIASLKKSGNAMHDYFVSELKKRDESIKTLEARIAGAPE